MLADKRWEKWIVLPKICTFCSFFLLPCNIPLSMFVVLGNLYIRQTLYQLPTSRVCNFSIVFPCIIDSILQYDGKLFCKAFISALTGKLVFLSYKCNSNSAFSLTAVFSSSLQSLFIKTFLCLPLGSKGVVPWTLPHSMKTVSIFLLYKLSRCTLSFS